MRMGGETSLIGLFLYLIEMSPLLNLGAGPLDSSEPCDVSRRRTRSFVSTVRFDFCEFFVISDFPSLVADGDGCLDEALLLLSRIFFTVLLDTDETMDESEMTGPRVFFGSCNFV